MITANNIINLLEDDSSPIKDIITYFFSLARKSGRSKIININGSIHVKETIEIPPDINDTDLGLLAKNYVQKFLQKINDNISVKLLTYNGLQYIFAVNVTDYSSPPIKASITFNNKVNSNMMWVCESDIWLDTPYISKAQYLTNSLLDSLKKTIKLVFQYFNPTFKNIAYK